MHTSEWRSYMYVLVPWSLLELGKVPSMYHNTWCDYHYCDNMWARCILGHGRLFNRKSTNCAICKEEDSIQARICVTPEFSHCAIAKAFASNVQIASWLISSRLINWQVAHFCGTYTWPLRQRLELRCLSLTDRGYGSQVCLSVCQSVR